MSPFDILTLLVILGAFAFSVVGGVAVFATLQSTFGELSLWYIPVLILVVGWGGVGLLNQMTCGGMSRIWFGYDE